MQATLQKRDSWLDRPLLTSLTLNAEIILFILLLVIGVFTRFYDLESRVMSHDENSHVYYSWLLSRGQGYTHDPITHGPFQFHAIALSYFLLGDNDFTARVPVVLFSIATIAFMWAFRRYLGRAGALVAAALMVISPYMLYYGRYVRNEAYVALFGVVTLWAILRYAESGKLKYLFYLTAATVFHFITKETSFIYTAQAMIFLAFLLIFQLSQKVWPRAEYRNRFMIALLVGLLLIASAGTLQMIESGPAEVSQVETTSPDATGESPAAEEAAGSASILPIVFAGLGGVALVAAALFAVYGYTWASLREERAFDMLIILGTMVLPMLAPFPVKLLGFNPIDYNNTQNVMVTAAFVGVFSLLAIGVGLLWKPRVWLLNAALFYSIFTIFYTTVFTNGQGFFTGLVGSLGYWLAQQAVNRGSQPLYYYALIQLPIYEFLPLIGGLLAFVLALIPMRASKGVDERLHVSDQQLATDGGTPVQRDTNDEPERESDPVKVGDQKLFLSLLGYWAVTSMIAYTIAGEKMPWLTVHITLPLIILTGWSIGVLIDRTDWGDFLKRSGLLVLALLPVFLISTTAAMGSLLGLNPPFQGKELEQLRATGEFMTSFIVAAGSAAGLFYLVKSWSGGMFARVVTLSVLAFLGVLTARAAFRAAYINYDNAAEYLVYAHSAPGVKRALSQIEEISKRAYDGLDMPVAYDNETSYPYWWYLRNYPNQRYYGENPTRSLRDVPAILVGDGNYGKIEAVVGQTYERFDYVRLWWPIQDYYDLTWERVLNTIRDPQMRSAVFQIWLNRDYKLYSELVGRDLSLPNWYPSARMRLYVRKDVVSKLWNYGAAPSVEAIVADPFEDKQVSLSADQIIGSSGNQPGQLQRPRDLAVAADGSIYVADTGNNRIQHFASDGSLLNVWGNFGNAADGSAAGSTFNEPWGIAQGPDGSVYVADLWNHRIQKFTAEGEFITMWGFFGQAETPEAFWGPRDVAVDAEGRVYVTDTGNKRIVIFDSNGNYLAQFGETGLAPGEFDEPVGVAVDGEGRVYVADTWNQRIQVFEEGEPGNYQVVTTWDVSAWYGQSLDNKPYLAVDSLGRVYTTDPEGYRVLVFTNTGDPVLFWGDYGTEADRFGMTGSVAVDGEGGVWVSDVANNRLMHFVVPIP